MTADERHEGLGHKRTRYTGRCVHAQPLADLELSEDQALHPRVRALLSVSTGARNRPWSERGPQLCRG